MVRERVVVGTLHLSGWWYDVATGGMLAYQRESRKFEAIDRDMVERMLNRIDAGPTDSENPGPSRVH